MASEEKKRKAKNSYIYNGGEKTDSIEWKHKRICSYNKRGRNRNKKIKNYKYD